MNLTLTPHHSITVTTPRSLSGADRQAIHDWHQHGHDVAATSHPTVSYPSGNHAAFPSERDEQ